MTPVTKLKKGLKKSAIAVRYRQLPPREEEPPWEETTLETSAEAAATTGPKSYTRDTTPEEAARILKQRYVELQSELNEELNQERSESPELVCPESQYVDPLIPATPVPAPPPKARKLPAPDSENTKRRKVVVALRPIFPNCSPQQLDQMADCVISVENNMLSKPSKPTEIYVIDD